MKKLQHPPESAEAWERLAERPYGELDRHFHLQPAAAGTRATSGIVQYLVDDGDEGHSAGITFWHPDKRGRQEFRGPDERLYVVETISAADGDARLWLFWLGVESPGHPTGIGLAEVAYVYHPTLGYGRSLTTKETEYSAPASYEPTFAVIDDFFKGVVRAMEPSSGSQE